MFQKRSALLLFLFLFSFVSTQAQQQVTIKGTITRPQSDTLSVVIYTNPLSNQEQISAARINPSGDFTVNVPVNQPVLADLIYGEEAVSLFLEPGYDLTLTANGINGTNFLKTLKYTGKGAAENNYISQFHFKFIENEGYQALPDNIHEKERGFGEFVDYNKKDMYKFYNAYLKDNALSEAFKAYAVAEIEYTWANDKITYADLREKVLHTEPRIILSPNYFDFVNAVSVNNPAAMLSPAYQTYLRNYINHHVATAKHKKTDPDYYTACYDNCKQKLQGDNQKLVISQIIKEAINNSHLKYTEPMIKELASLNLKKEQSDYLLHTFNEKKRFSPGSPAPDFKLLSVNGDSISLSSFKGKVVYLSFWNTTCGLCLVDMPHAQRLSEKMKDANIVFLQVAVDTDKTQWQKMITTKKLPGTHVIATNPKTDLVKQYNLETYPAYFIISEDGTFLTTKANRPSNHGLEKELLTALQ